MADESAIDISLMVIGNSEVGKTDFVGRYMDNKFVGLVSGTIGLDVRTKAVDIEGKRVNLSLLDTSGNYRYRPVIQSYYASSDGHIVLFDLTNLESFFNQRHWLQEVDNFSRRGAVVERLMIGNKTDRNRIILHDEAKAYGESLNVHYYAETSARDGINITEAVNGMVSRLLYRRGHIQAKTDQSSTCLCL